MSDAPTQDGPSLPKELELPILAIRNTVIFPVLAFPIWRSIFGVPFLAFLVWRSRFGVPVWAFPFWRSRFGVPVFSASAVFATISVRPG